MMMMMMMCKRIKLGQMLHGPSGVHLWVVFAAQLVAYSLLPLLHLRLRTRQLPTVTNCPRLAPLRKTKTRLMVKKSAANSWEKRKENILENHGQVCSTLWRWWSFFTGLKTKQNKQCEMLEKRFTFQWASAHPFINISFNWLTRLGVEYEIKIRIWRRTQHARLSHHDDDDTVCCRRQLSIFSVCPTFCTYFYTYIYIFGWQHWTWLNLINGAERCKPCCLAAC